MCMMLGKCINISMIVYFLLMRKKKINWYINFLRVCKSEKFVFVCIEWFGWINKNIYIEVSVKVMDWVWIWLLVNRYGLIFRGVNWMLDKEKYLLIYYYRYCFMWYM